MPKIPKTPVEDEQKIDEARDDILRSIWNFKLASEQALKKKANPETLKRITTALNHLINHLVKASHELKGQQKNKHDNQNVVSAPRQGGNRQSGNKR